MDSNVQEQSSGPNNQENNNDLFNMMMDTIPIQQTNNDLGMNMDFNTLSNINQQQQPIIDEEEQKRLNKRKEENDLRRQKIQEKIQKEETMRQDIRKKAAEFMVEFENKRQEEIAKRRKTNEENEKNKNKGGNAQGTSDSWAMVNNNIDLKEGDYKGSKDVQRMREAMQNRKNDPNAEPLQSLFK